MSTFDLSWLVLAGSLGCGLVAGVLFGFSTFVMPALVRLPPARGIAAMQSINVKVMNPAFLTAFVGTAIVCLVIGALAVLRWHEPGAGLRLAGAALYVFGMVGITRIVHIPRNDALGTLDPDAPATATYWTGYVATWMPWNHLRTAAGLVAAGLLAGSLRVAAGS